MKKFTSAMGLLAIISIFLFSFSKNNSTKEKNQVTYTWIKYNCGSWYSAQVQITSSGTNGSLTSESSIPTSWSNPNFSGCGSSGSNVCAIRFAPGEFEPIPGYNGQIRPKANINPWDGNHMIAYCN